MQRRIAAKKKRLGGAPWLGANSKQSAKRLAAQADMRDYMHPESSRPERVAVVSAQRASGQRVDNSAYDAERAAMARVAHRGTITNMMGVSRPAPTPRKPRPDPAPEHSEHRTRPASRPHGPKKKSAPERRKERGTDGQGSSSGGRRKCPPKDNSSLKVSIVRYKRGGKFGNKVKSHCRGDPTH